MKRANYHVLIPSHGRPRSLAKLFKACPTLNTPNTFVGLEEGEFKTYLELFARQGVAWDKANKVLYRTARGYPSNARHILKRTSFNEGGAARYVLSDDNCRFSDESLQSLLAAQRFTSGVVAGFHPTFSLFHKDQISKTGRVDPRTKVFVYDKVQMIFWCLPAKMYDLFTYPEDVYYDDVYFNYWCLSRGFTNFTVCREAVFDKRRHEAGGTGNAQQRMLKQAESMLRIAQDFPQWATSGTVAIRPPYAYMVKSIREGRHGFHEQEAVSGED